MAQMDVTLELTDAQRKAFQQAFGADATHLVLTAAQTYVARARSAKGEMLVDLAAITGGATRKVDYNRT